MHIQFSSGKWGYAEARTDGYYFGEKLVVSPTLEIIDSQIRKVFVITGTYLV